MLNDKGSTGILLIIGVALILVGIGIGIYTGLSEVNTIRASNGDTSNIIPVMSSTFLGYLSAIVFMVIGAVAIILGIRG
jgi:hypothetical protein